MKCSGKRMKWVLGVAAALAWACAFLFIPEPTVSLRFSAGVDAEVRQVVEDSGRFHLEVKPGDAAAKMTALTIAGIPVFPYDWLVSNVASATPLGESGIVDFPRLFDLLPRLFRLARVCLALFPFAVLLLAAAVRLAVPFLERRCGRRAFLFALALTSLLAFPEPVSDVAPGLDPSWSWFLCAFAFRNVFGSEVVFTYGPLGFLLNPQLSWGCVLCAFAANVVFAVLWFRLLRRIYDASEGGRAAAWTLLFTTMIPVSMEWRWTLLAVLQAAMPTLLSDRERPGRLREWALAGLLAAVVSLMKFSSLTIVVGSQLFCLGALAIRYGRKAWRPAAAFCGAGALAFLSLSAMCFSSFGAWTAWVRGSLATASGYNLYMVAEKTWLELALPLLVGGWFAATAGWRRCILFAPLLFLTAKYAWVRQSSGPMAYAAVLLAAACLVVGRGRLRGVAVGGGAAFALNVALVLPFALSGLAGPSSLFGWRPTALMRTLALPRAVRASMSRSASAMSPCRLPVTWRRRIASGNVAFLPFDYGAAMSDGTLDVKPLPSLQLYSACHPYLDALNAAFFERQIPDFVVCGLDANWSGHFIDYPRTWTALLAGYECVDEDESRVLMTRRKLPRTRQGSEVSVSPSLPPFEKLRGTFLRRPVEYAVLVRDDGKRTRFQFVRGNQGIPFPIEWIPFDDAEMRDILRGGRGRVAGIEFLPQNTANVL